MHWFKQPSITAGITPATGRIISSSAIGSTGKPNVIVVQKGGQSRKLVTSIAQPGVVQSQGATPQAESAKSPLPIIMQSGFEKVGIALW